MDGQDTKWRRNIAENFNRLSRAHERYRQTTDRQTTDGRPMTYSEHEREFTFANDCPDAENWRIASSFVWTKHCNVTKGQTDRRTDRILLASTGVCIAINADAL